jgi:hypothetical protein
MTTTPKKAQTNFQHKLDGQSDPINKKTKGRIADL